MQISWTPCCSLTHCSKTETRMLWETERDRKGTAIRQKNIFSLLFIVIAEHFFLSVFYVVAVLSFSLFYLSCFQGWFCLSVSCLVHLSLTWLFWRLHRLESAQRCKLVCWKHIFLVISIVLLECFVLSWPGDPWRKRKELEESVMN